jgi:flavin reductase (DIM6/NTAB) family NADH-FMN oxidoreductase RutF
MNGGTADVTDDDVDTAVRVLKVAQRDTERASAIRSVIMPSVSGVQRRQKQQQRQQKKAEAADTELSGPPPPSASSVLHEPALDGVVHLVAPHLSRPLYANPVCFLGTWQAGGCQRNLMTISWLTAIDNDGHFLCSMNQRRHSARNLASNPFLVLSVACAGLESLLCKVGGCSGRGVADKPRALDVPLCQPGWRPLQPNAAADADADLDAASAALSLEDDGGPHQASNAARPSSSHEEHPWPAEGLVELPAVTDADLERARMSAFAVAPGVAHVLARVTSVRGIHGHFLLVCETIGAYARSEYWSGKTLEPQHDGLPPILSFVGSQKFNHSVPARGASPAPP